MIALQTAHLPAPDTAVLEENGCLGRLYYFLLRALLLRTGDTGGVPDTVGAALAAGAASSSGAHELVDDFNEILTGAGGGVRLFDTLQAGQSQSVFNGSGGGISVYPPSGGTIDAGAVNAAYALANGKTQIFTCYNVNVAGLARVRSLQLG